MQIREKMLSPLRWDRREPEVQKGERDFAQRTWSNPESQRQGHCLSPGKVDFSLPPRPVPGVGGGNPLRSHAGARAGSSACAPSSTREVAAGPGETHPTPSRRPEEVVHLGAQDERETGVDGTPDVCHWVRAPGKGRAFQ